MARQERAIRTRRVILEAAGAVFDEHGYAATTISMVLERAEVTKGALYFHFPSKESLAQAVLDEQMPFGVVPPQPCKLQELVDMTFVFGQRLIGNSLLKGSVRLAVDQSAPPVSTMPGRSGSGRTIWSGCSNRPATRASCCPPWYRGRRWSCWSGRSRGSS